MLRVVLQQPKRITSADQAELPAALPSGAQPVADCLLHLLQSIHVNFELIPCFAGNGLHDACTLGMKAVGLPAKKEGRATAKHTW